MQKVVLIFEDITIMTEFILAYRLSHAEVDSREISLTAFLSEEQVTTAFEKYGALVVPLEQHLPSFDED
jgi:hypothetical protein